jgi:predicted aldo/keto reductase-like oxidoreductase
MSHMDRRGFLRLSAAGALAAGFGFRAQGQAAAAHATPTALTATTERTLGKTGLKCSFLGMGTGTRGGADQRAPGREHFVGCLEHAYDQGLRYFDLADNYGSHDYMKDALKRGMEREKLMLLSKTPSRTAEAVKADIDRYLKELDTDYLDIVLLHCLTEPDWTERYKGAMDALSEAKSQGKVKAVGCSNHDFGALKAAAASPWVDVILARINPAGVLMDASPEEVAPVLKQAHDAGKGILGMKIVGEGQLKDRMPESLKYVMGLGCVDAITIGFVNPDEIDDAAAKIDAVHQA